MVVYDFRWMLLVCIIIPNFLQTYKYTTGNQLCLFPKSGASRRGAWKGIEESERKDTIFLELPTSNSLFLFFLSESPWRIFLRMSSNVFWNLLDTRSSYWSASDWWIDILKLWLQWANKWLTSSYPLVDQIPPPLENIYKTPLFPN